MEFYRQRLLEGVAIAFSRGSSQPKEWNRISCNSCIGRWILYHQATWEAQYRASVWFILSVIFNSLRPHELQHARLPCPLPTPGACLNSCSWNRWCRPTISSSVIPFSSYLQSFPASGSFPRSEFFTSGGQSIGGSASASVFPTNIQDWFPLELTSFICLQSKELSRVVSTPQFKSINSLALSFFHSPTLTSIHDHWKNHILD